MRTSAWLRAAGVLTIALCACRKQPAPVPRGEDTRSETGGGVAPTPVPVTKNPTPPMTKRKLTDVTFTAEMTRENLAAVWGPPDGPRGSGVEYYAYAMENGDEVWVVFSSEPPHRLTGALLVSPVRGTREWVFQVAP